MGIFFLFIFIHNSFFYLLLSLHQSTQNDQTNIFSVLETPRGAPSALFCSEKRPGGAILELLYRTPRGTFTPLVTVSTRFSLTIELSRLTRDRTAEPVSREQIIRRKRGQGNIHFSYSTDHKQDWQPYQVDPYPCYM